MSNKGRRYELDLSNDIIENTTEEVHVAISDYSGNSKNSFCDMEVYFPTPTSNGAYGSFLEVKNYSGDSGKRETVLSGSSQDESGLGELKRLIDGTPPWGVPYFVVNWSNRKVAVVNAIDLQRALADDRDVVEGPPFFDARLTPSKNVSMRKPTLDNWDSSAASSEDWWVVGSAIGLQTTHVKDDVEVGEVGA